ncbi:hypothetical protein [Micromonospora sp. RTP1Z1]|uniref:hypothetical protein n=1 Tax=Micromonospora sp. RTP1Z1 TaxID=2994043 RepID=UPI0029C966FD|nr:hypothetical protein [Micromonospora sp. RTP1Z1]
MDVDEIGRRLRHEWDAEDGFLTPLRWGECGPARAERFLSLLRSIDPADPAVFDRRIVGPMFLMPYYMLSHLQNSESLGVDTRAGRAVLYEALDLIGRIVAGGEGQSGGDRVDR